MNDFSLNSNQCFLQDKDNVSTEIDAEKVKEYDKNAKLDSKKVAVEVSKLAEASISLNDTTTSSASSASMKG